MDKRTEFSAALKESLKKRDETAVASIRLILAALKDRDIAARSTGNSEGISEDEIFSMLQSMIKQRKESAKLYCDAGREELAEREEAEIEVIQGFLPQQLSEGEAEKAIEDAIAETGALSIKDMGKIMGVLKTRHAGQMDMGKVGALVKKKLA
ncbi:MAG: GatB/YqeY domain-containing protein [Alphaproteobacteria bacterium]|nr:GatB/YqeY domain-containing protein [Alphaproteobacteria bacterium]